MKSKIKLHQYILTFTVLLSVVVIIGDTIKYFNYRHTLIQNFSNKYINFTQQTREGFRLLFDKLQHDFIQTESNNIDKLNQLYEIYKRDEDNFNIDKAATEINKNIPFGKYQIFLINKGYIVENSSYKKDIGYDLGQHKVIRDLIDSIYNQKQEIDISPIKVDSSSMQFKRFLLKRSDDGNYLLQIAYVLDIFTELKQKYNQTKDWGKLELYLATENILQKVELDNNTIEKQSLKKGWDNTKKYLLQFATDLSINMDNISTITNSDINDKSIQINSEIEKIFSDDILLAKLNLSQQQFFVYSITDSLFNKSSETKLIIKTTYSTKDLDKDLKATLYQTVIQLIITLTILVLIYLFIIKRILNPILLLIENVTNNRQSDIKDIKTEEIDILNNRYNDLHIKLNKGIELNKNLLNENKRFIADTVHQIRTPLTNIMVNAEMVKELQNDDSQSYYIDKIDSSINMLSNSFEDLSYITTVNTIEYLPINIDFQQMLNKRIDFFSTISKVNKKEIESNVEDDIVININEIELERLIDNNISNGIKYATKNKSITINLYQINEAISLEFRSYGQPIKNREKVFDKNYRENEAKRGLGLGLNIVRCICEKYNIDHKVSYENGQNIFTYILR